MMAQLGDTSGILRSRAWLKPRNLLAAAVALAAMGSFTSIIASDISSGRFSSSHRQGLENLYGTWDRQFEEAAGGNGLNLKFDGFHGSSLKLESELFYRAVYALYPRPVVETSTANDETLAGDGIGGVLTLKPAGPGIEVESWRRIVASSNAAPTDAK